MLFMEYHHPVFYYLNDKYSKEIAYALTEKPKQIRAKLVLDILPVGLVLSGKEVWEKCKIILDLLEENFVNILNQRNPIYWLHIYRRLSPVLCNGHEGKIDPQTASLVRKTTELAFYKYGSLEKSSELYAASKISSDRIMNGLFVNSMKKLHMIPKAQRKMFLLKTLSALKKSNTLVLKDFRFKDLESVYFSEGLSYQYWRLSALMRYVGKGGKFIVKTNGDWDYVKNNELDFLIQSYDNRICHSSSASLFSGVWMRDTDKNGGFYYGPIPFSVKDKIFPIPLYNVKQETLENNNEYSDFGLSKDYIPNFIITNFDINEFLSSVSFMNDEFTKKKGFSLNQLVTVLFALSSVQLIRDCFIKNFTDETLIKNILNSMVQIMNRGYSVHGISKSLNEQIYNRIQFLGLRRMKKSKIQKIVDFLVATQSKKEFIGLWSGGPRPLLIKSTNSFLFDSAGIYDLLQTVFFRTKDVKNLKGYSFEGELKSMLKDLEPVP